MFSNRSVTDGVRLVVATSLPDGIGSDLTVEVNGMPTTVAPSMLVETVPLVAVFGVTTTPAVNPEAVSDCAVSTAWSILMYASSYWLYVATPSLSVKTWLVPDVVPRMWQSKYRAVVMDVPRSEMRSTVTKVLSKLWDRSTRKYAPSLSDSGTQATSNTLPPGKLCFVHAQMSWSLT